MIIIATLYSINGGDVLKKVTNTCIAKERT